MKIPVGLSRNDLEKLAPTLPRFDELTAGKKIIDSTDTTANSGGKIAVAIPIIAVIKIIRANVLNVLTMKNPTTNKIPGQILL